MSCHVIELKNLELSYNSNFQAADSSLFKEVNFLIRGGEAAVIYAPNGTGKTSLLRLIGGDYRAATLTKGEINYHYNNSNYQRCPDIEGYVAFAGLAVADYISEHLDFITVQSVIASGISGNYYHSGAIPETLLNDVKEIAQHLSLHELLGEPYSSLSAGQRMLVVFARAVVVKPQLLILDEVDQYLSTNSIGLVAEILNRLKLDNPNLIILAASHQSYSKAIIYEGFKQFDLLPNEWRNIEVFGAKKERLSNSFSQPVHLEIENAFIHLDSKVPWRLAIKELIITGGECWHLAGDNGVGKSTLLKALAGKVAFHADSKKVQLNNKPIYHSFRHDADVRIRYCGGFIEDRRIEGIAETDFTLFEYLAGAEQGVHALYADNQPLLARTLEWLNWAQLLSYIEAPINTLSSGQRKRFEIVVAIAANGGVVLLDEPFNNLDRSSISVIIDAIRLLKNDKRALIIAAHDIPTKMEEHITKRAVIKGNQLLLSD